MDSTCLPDVNTDIRGLNNILLRQWVSIDFSDATLHLLSVAARIYLHQVLRHIPLLCYTSCTDSSQKRGRKAHHRRYQSTSLK